MIIYINIPESSKIHDDKLLLSIYLFSFLCGIIGSGISLITERKKILFDIEKDYENSCNIVEKYLVDNRFEYSIKKHTIPYLNTKTIIRLSLMDFKIVISKGMINDIGIEMSPIKILKNDGKYLEEIIIKKIEES